MEAIALIFWGLALVPYSLFPVVLRALGQKPKSLEEATHQAKLVVAQKLFKEESDINLIAKVTDLSISELEKIKKMTH